MIGFYLPSCDNFNTVMMLRIARLAQELGYNSSVTSGVELSNNYTGFFQKRINRLDESNLSSWLDKLSFLIVPATCPDRVISWSQQKKLSLVMVIDWNRPINDLKNNVRAADYVVCQSWSICRSLRDNWGLKSTRYIPWDSGLPITRRYLEPNPYRLMLPLSTNSKELSVFESTQFACRLLKKVPELVIDLVTSKSLSRKANQFISSVAVGSGKRLLFTKVSAIDHLIKTFMRNDILLTTDSEQSMYGSLMHSMGLSLGLPLIGFDMTVTQELVISGRNGILVPLKLKTVDNLPEIDADIDEFEKAVVKIFSQKNTARKLRRNSAHRLVERRDTFVKGWQELWSH